VTVRITERLEHYRNRVDNALQHHLPRSEHTGTTLEAAMCYATLNGGKRVRPVLVYATGCAFGADPDILDVPACAIEFMHAYSLVHDDLPSMDDDDLRRGNPTCHKNQVSASTTIAMIDELGRASGIEGMAAGQAIDLHAVGQTLDLEQLEAMHRCKTGALIRASVILGATPACLRRCNWSVFPDCRRYSGCSRGH